MAMQGDWPSGETVTCQAPEHYGSHTCDDDCVRPRRPSGRTCISCQQDLSGSEMTSAWEDGDNADAYVSCRHCGAHNLV